MKTNMSYGTISEVMTILDKFSEATGVLGMDIARTKNDLREEFAIFEKERNKLIMKYGKTDENGNYSVPQDGSDNYRKFIMELAQIIEMSIEINIYQCTKEQFETIYNNPKVLENKDITVRDYEILAELFIEGRLKRSNNEPAETEVADTAETAEIEEDVSEVED